VSDPLEIVMEFTDGELTPEKAMEAQERLIDLLNAVAEEVAPGEVAFKLTRMQWVDDGKNTITLRVTP